MESNNYIVIQGWMCNDLDLKGNELLIFALIHGFSQDGVSKFRGGRKYIADTFNITLPTVDKALKGLVDKGYLNKEGFDDFVNPNVYWVNFEVVKKLYGGSKETLLGGSKETLLNNNSNKNINNKKILSKDNIEFEFGKTKPKKENLYSKCVALIDNKTDDDAVRKLLIEWLNMLLEKYKARERVLYVNVFKGKLNMLDKFDKEDWAEIIEYNLQRGYEGFYPVNNRNQSDVRNQPWNDGVVSRRYTEEELEENEKLTKKRIAEGKRVIF